MLTLSQITQYVRAECNELDSGRVDDEQIKRYVNFAQIRVQNEFFQINFKAFTRTAFFTGCSFVEPSDLMQYPNSIINLKASTGTVKAYATANYTTPTAAIVHTLREPGTSGNSVGAVLIDGGTFGTASATGTVVVTHSGSKWYFDFFIGDTVTAIVAAFNADPLYSKYFVCSSATSGSTVPAPTIGQELDLVNGAGTGWYAADESSSENFVRIEGNTYKASSATSPKFRRIGSPLGTQSKLIQVLPHTVNFVELEYYNRLADLSATTDTLDVPPEVEEIVLLDVQRRIYEKTGDVNKKGAMEQEYQTKFNQFVKGYTDKRGSEVAEKQRMQSADITN